MPATKNYTIHCYSDADTIGEIDLTAEQFARYIRNADTQTGAIEIRYLPGGSVMSIIVPAATAVYLD